MRTICFCFLVAIAIFIFASSVVSADEVQEKFFTISSSINGDILKIELIPTAVESNMLIIKNFKLSGSENCLVKELFVEVQGQVGQEKLFPLSRELELNCCWVESDRYVYREGGHIHFFRWLISPIPQYVSLSFENVAAYFYSSYKQDEYSRVVSSGPYQLFFNNGKPVRRVTPVQPKAKKAGTWANLKNGRH